ncbi:Down syndrome cell adhesion molecule-like protein 1 [Mizuhopecten yessoensis]|uniref:Down syndrome cell adhesion molecule-like protein 1 n=1 Tax=Mizuhopecten yessoensis TaxID=6573 RepID=UPI000B45A2BD|nr:Down syndrome cell adhesion molecule-like protein 1 [Mizuhopecten yessoensis]
MGCGQEAMWFILVLFPIQVTGIGGTCTATLNNFVPYEEKTKATLTCTIDQCQNYTGAYPHPVTWFKSNSDVTAGVTSTELPNNGSRSTLVMTLQRSDNTKVIKCSSPAAESVSKTLNVTYKPVVTITPTPNPLLVTENKNVTLTCGIDSNPTPMSTQWRFGTAVISTKPILQLTASRLGSGVYQCSVANAVGTAQAVIELQVEYGPRSVSLSPSTSVYERTEGIDEMPVISCSADCNPPCKYKWGRTTSPVLDLGITGRQEAGTHTCQAYNKIGTASASINVKVRYPPDIVENGGKGAEEGEEYWSRCIARGIPANYTYHEWYQVYEDGGPRVQTGNLTSTGWMHVSDLSYMHNGMYYCSVSNGVATPEGQAITTGPMGALRVNGPPHDLQSLYTKTGILGSTVMFLADFFQFSQGQITVMWYNVTSGEVVTPRRGNITLETISSYKTKFYSTDVTTSGYRIVATISEITAWDFGYYVVHLESVGQKRVVHLRVDREGETASVTLNGWLVSTIILLLVLAGCVLIVVWVYRRGVLPRCGKEKEKDTSSGVGDTDVQNYSDSPTIDAVTYDPSVYTSLQIRQGVVPENPYGNVQSEPEHTYECLKAKGNIGHRSPEAAPAEEQELPSATDTSLYQNVNVTMENQKKIRKPPKPHSKPKLQLPKKSKNKQNTEGHSNGAFKETENM